MRKWAEMGCWERRFFAVESCFYPDTHTLLESAYEAVQKKTPEDPFVEGLFKWFSVKWEQESQKARALRSLIWFHNYYGSKNKENWDQDQLNNIRMAADALDYKEAASFIRKTGSAILIAGLFFTGVLIGIRLFFPPPIIIYPIWGWILAAVLISIIALILLSPFAKGLLFCDTPHKQIEISVLRLERALEEKSSAESINSAALCPFGDQEENDDFDSAAAGLIHVV